MDAGRLLGVLIDSVLSSTGKVFTVHIIVKVTFFGAEADESSSSLAYGTLGSALGFCCTLRRLVTAPWGCVWAKGPAAFSTRVSRERWSKRSGSSSTGCHTIVPGSRFVHQKGATLECLVVETANSFLGV